MLGIRIKTGAPCIEKNQKSRILEGPASLTGSLLMPNAFISYGGPDVGFAAQLNDDLKKAGVKTFFFPESAQFGRKLHHEMRDNIQEADRVILLCSRSSLRRPGVENEIEETLAREAAEGGSSILVPVALDDFVYSDWTPREAGLAIAIRRRVIADFSGCLQAGPSYQAQLSRLVAAIASDYATLPLSYKSKVTILDEGGARSLWRIVKNVLVNHGSVESYSFNDIDVSGSVVGAASNSGALRSFKKGGATIYEVKFSRPYLRGEVFDVELTLDLVDCHTAQHEDLRSRIVAPWQRCEWCVQLPSSRPAQSVVGTVEFNGKKKKEAVTILEANMASFMMVATQPKLGAYYSLEWVW